MRTVLYSLSLSHPGHAARLMLERKGIEHRVVNLLPGMHPVLLRALGFAGGTVPALKVDGRRIQGSLAISRALDELQPEPPLFPGDPELRESVEEAEAWGERELQGTPRVPFRWSAAHRQSTRRWVAEREGLPAPGLLAAANLPIARLLARVAGADERGVRTTLAGLPGLLDQVDTLLATGVIGGAEPNAADFQILTTVRSLLAQDDTRAFAAGRPCEAPARALWPDATEPVPGGLPGEWLEAALADAGAGQPARSSATA